MLELKFSIYHREVVKFRVALCAANDNEAIVLGWVVSSTS